MHFKVSSAKRRPFLNNSSMPQLSRWFGRTVLEVRAWMSHYSLLCYMDVSTYPCLNLQTDMLAKQIPGIWAVMSWSHQWFNHLLLFSRYIGPGTHLQYKFGCGVLIQIIGTQLPQKFTPATLTMLSWPMPSSSKSVRWVFTNLHSGRLSVKKRIKQYIQQFTAILVLALVQRQPHATGVRPGTKPSGTIALAEISGMILGLRPANERRCYFVTTFLIGWVQAENQPWICTSYVTHRQYTMFMIGRGVGNMLTHLRLVPQICVIESGHHWLK